MKVLVSDNIAERGVEILKEKGLEVDVNTGLAPEELKKIIGGYDALIIRSATKVTAEIIEAAEKLKVIGRAGSGLDNVDRNAATMRGIVVMNTPGGNTITTAEHTVALMFSMARQVPQATASLKAGKWEKKKFRGVELYNKTLGIMGLGNIGAHVSKVAKGAGMNVIAYDPFLSEEKAKSLGIKSVTFDELIERSDFITIHTPLTKETKGCINKDTIARMKEGVRIINAARGGIINEKDLYDALQSGKVAAAACDVFEVEPPEGNPLLELNNLVATPHLGASTDEAQDNVAIAVTEQIADYLLNGEIRNAVNIPSVPAEILPTLKPYLELAEKLGSFISQSFEGGIDKVTVEYMGDVSKLVLEPIKIAVLKGLLEPILEDTINFVNAPFIAKERGIEVKEITTDDAGDYHSMLVIKVKAGKKESVISGVLHGKKDPRIIAIDGHVIEVRPRGYMLFLTNNDKPGVIGDVGTTLGKNGINIARMQFGREGEGGIAISVVSIDTPASEEILADIKKLPNVLSTKQIYIPK
jgi:D-3-phosphoglycerate dehydrogenase